MVEQGFVQGHVCTLQGWGSNSQWDHPTTEVKNLEFFWVFSLLFLSSKLYTGNQVMMAKFLLNVNKFAVLLHKWMDELKEAGKYR